MPIKKNSQQIRAVYKGSQYIGEIYKGSDHVFSAGWDKTVSGASPLTLSNCRAKPLTAYSVSGNTVQSGTPTPENPVEVNGVGNRTINMFNGNAELGAHSLATGERTVSTSWVRNVTNITVSANTQYTISCKAVSGKVINVYVFEYAEDNSFIGIAVNNLVPPKAFTTSATTAYIRFQFGFYPRETITVETIQKIMVAEGTETEYEPYGYKVPVTVSGKSLINFNGQEITSTRCTIPNTTYVSGLPTSVYISFDVSADYEYSATAWIFVIYRQNGTYVQIYSSDAASHIGGRKSISATTTADNPFTRIECRKSGINAGSLSNFMITKQADGCEYEPYRAPVTSNVYLPSSLQKIGSFADSVSSAGAMTREVAAVVLDGTTHRIGNYWSGSAVSGPTFYTTATLPYAISINCDGMSNYFSRYNGLSPVASSLADGEFFMRSSKNSLMIRDDRFTGDAAGVNAFNAWLEAQYAAGTPVTIYYQLANPTTEQVTAPTIALTEGTNIVSVDTEVQPSAIYTTYKSKKP